MGCSSRIIGATGSAAKQKRGGELGKIGGPVIQEPGAPKGAPAQPAITHYCEPAAFTAKAVQTSELSAKLKPIRL